LHRAFDRGLVAINPDDYTVMISKRLTEPVTSTYSIRQFEGQKIKRPNNEKYNPTAENLQRHLERFTENF
jgi:putative restriction endonuclease